MTYVSLPDAEGALSYAGLNMCQQDYLKVCSPEAIELPATRAGKKGCRPSKDALDELRVVVLPECFIARPTPLPVPIRTNVRGGEVAEATHTEAVSDQEAEAEAHLSIALVWYSFREGYRSLGLTRGGGGGVMWRIQRYVSAFPSVAISLSCGL